MGEGLVLGSYQYFDFKTNKDEKQFILENAKFLLKVVLICWEHKATDIPVPTFHPMVCKQRSYIQLCQ